MLRVVRAPTGSQEGGDPPKQRRPGPPRALTDGEAMRLAAALRHLKSLYGGWDVLASVMGMSANSLCAISRGRHRPGASVARKAALAAGKPLDALLAGITDASKCPHCGRGAS